MTEGMNFKLGIEIIDKNGEHAQVGTAWEGG
jgi:hypothetical protein